MKHAYDATTGNIMGICRPTMGVGRDGRPVELESPQAKFWEAQGFAIADGNRVERAEYRYVDGRITRRVRR